MKISNLTLLLILAILIASNILLFLLIVHPYNNLYVKQKDYLLDSARYELELKKRNL